MASLVKGLERYGGIAIEYLGANGHKNTKY